VGQFYQSDLKESKMLIVISPAKTLDFESPVLSSKFTQPDLLKDSEKLIRKLRELNTDDIAKLMHVSSKIAELNFGRFLNWDKRFTTDNARQAIYAFKGDVYTGLEADKFSGADLNFAQKHLRILSGLYGILRPLDLIQPYRLEMGTSLKNIRGDNLYDYWSAKVSELIEQALEAQQDKWLVNLASNEYFKVLDESRMQAKILTPVFKDYKNGQYKIISFFAKKARGRMAAYIIRNKIKTPAELQKFNLDAYSYSAKDSDERTQVFLRNSH
jgi:cytoplasmic iron level regulating protein YaaA (DUF328/UPF0246 family)